MVARAPVCVYACIHVCTDLRSRLLLSMCVIHTSGIRVRLSARCTGTSTVVVDYGVIVIGKDGRRRTCMHVVFQSAP